MAESKKINLARFFKQDSASPSVVGVRDEKGINPQAQVVMSGSDLSGILEIIQTNTEINSEQKQIIIQEDKNDQLLQGLISTLQGRISGLQSSLSKLQSEFQSDLIARQQELRLRKRNQTIASAEQSKEEKGQSIATPMQPLMESNYKPTAAPEQSMGPIDSGGDGGGLLGPAGGAAIGAGSVAIPASGKFSTGELVSLARQAGMSKEVNVNGYKGPLDVLMGAVGMQESRGNPKSKRDDTQVYGLWQIRYPVHAEKLKTIGVTSPEQLFDPITNAKAAKMIYDSQGISAWEGFTDGNYKQFLPEAQKAGNKSSVQPAQQRSSASGTQASATSETSSQMTAGADLEAPTREIAITSPLPKTDKVPGNMPEATQVASNQAPIIIPVNKTQGPSAQQEVSAGDAIPGGRTSNANNFYSTLAQTILGIA